MKRKSLALNAFLNGFRSVLNILFPFITFPYVSRVLSVEGIGIYNFSNSVVSYFLLIAALGIDTYAVREGAKYRNNKKKITRFASEVFSINIYSTITAYLLLFTCLVLFYQLRNYILCILIFSLQIFFTTIGTEWIYQIYEDYIYITVRSIVFQLISILLLFIFVRNSQDYLNYAAITVFSAVGSNILNFIHSRQYCSIHFIRKFNWKKHLAPILVLFAANIATMIFANSDILLLGIMKSNYIVGIYSISSKIYQIGKNLIAALLIVTIPRLAMLFGKGKVKEYDVLLEKLTNTLILLALPASVGLFMLAKEVILIISGSNYLRSVSSLRILSCAFIFSILAWILSSCVLIPAKREKYMLFSSVTSATLNIILNIIFIPWGNENATAVSTVISELCAFLVNYYYSRDLVRKVFVSKKVLKNIVTSIIGCIGIVLICILCEIRIESLIITTVISIVSSVIIYDIILIILHNTFAIEVTKLIKLRILKFIKNK